MFFLSKKFIILKFDNLRKSDSMYFRLAYLIILNINSFVPKQRERLNHFYVYMYEDIQILNKYILQMKQFHPMFSLMSDRKL